MVPCYGVSSLPAILECQWHNKFDSNCRYSFRSSCLLALQSRELNFGGLSGRNKGKLLLVD